MARSGNYEGAGPPTLGNLYLAAIWILVGGEMEFPGVRIFGRCRRNRNPNTARPRRARGKKSCRVSRAPSVPRFRRDRTLFGAGRKMFFRVSGWPAEAYQPARLAEQTNRGTGNLEKPVIPLCFGASKDRIDPDED